MAWEFGAAVVGMFILSVAVRAAYRDAVRLAKSPPWVLLNVERLRSD